MKKHRSIITSFVIFILFPCFISKSEGRTIRPLDKILGEPLCTEWRAGYQHVLVDPIYYNFQNKGVSVYTPFCIGSYPFLSYTEIFKTLEKGCVFSKWDKFTSASQRPPPLPHDQS